MKQITSKLILVVMACSLLFSGCTSKKRSVRNYSGIDPRTIDPIPADKIEIDFIQVHNEVITNISEQYTPFFFILQDGFWINGTNNPKQITIDLTCLEGTTEQDAKLVLSTALHYIGIACSEQNNKYTLPEMDSENTYINFGSVFDDYALKIEVKNDKGEEIASYDVKAGEEIPIDPRYISEA